MSCFHLHVKHLNTSYTRGVSKFSYSIWCVLFVVFFIFGFGVLTKLQVENVQTEIKNQDGGINFYDNRVYPNLLRNSQIFSWPFTTINYLVLANNVASKYYSEVGKSITNTLTDRYWYWHLVLLHRRHCLTACTRRYLSATLVIKRFFQVRQLQRERETHIIFLMSKHKGDLNQNRN